MVVKIPGVTAGVVQIAGDKKFAQRVKCHYCGKIEDFFPNRGALPPEAIKKMAQRKGWDWSGNGRHGCPACLISFKTNSAKKKRCEKEATAGSDNHATSDATDEKTPDRAKRPPPGTTADAATDPQTLKRIFRFIDANYDEPGQRWAGTMTDAQAAAELDQPIEAIQATRDEFFGPQGTTDATVAMCAIDGLEELAEMAKTIAGFTQRAAAIAKQLEEKARSEIDDLNAVAKTDTQA